MRWPTAIAALLRFYNGAITWNDIWNMTVQQFLGLFTEMNVLITMETGEQGKTYLEGKVGEHYFMKLAAKNVRMKKGKK